MGGEVALGSFGDTASAPSNQSVLGEARVGVLDLDKSELDTALVEVFDELGELAIYMGKDTCQRIVFPRARSGARAKERGNLPPVLWTFSTLSLLPLSWKALAKGA